MVYLEINKTNYQNGKPKLIEKMNKYLSNKDAKIFINPGATGFGEKFAHLPVIILKELKINTFSKIDSRFTISFESNSGLSYIIEVTHDLKQWVEIGEVQGTGSSVEFTDWREALFQRQYYRLKLLE